MKIKGRHPEKNDSFLVEHVCNFIMYVTKGKGIVFAGNQAIRVQKDDVVYIPKNTRFAVEGIFEYVTVDSPGFYPEQSEEVTHS